MSVLFAGLVDASVAAALGLAAAAALRRRSAALRNWVLSIALVAAALMPALELAVPAWPLPLPWTEPAATSALRWTTASAPARGTAPAATSDATGRIEPRPASPSLALIALWLTGTALGLGGLAAALWRLRRIARRAESLDGSRSARLLLGAAAALGVRRPVRLLHSVDPPVVVTWGVRRPTVLLPAAAAGWSDDRLRVVLFHELGHVARGDWPIQMLAAVVRGVYWFNPLIWMLCRRIRQESEQACDDLVLRTGVDRTDYAAHLLDAARDALRMRHAWLPATPIARPSTLEGRIRAMLNATIARDPLSTPARYGITLAALALAAIVAGAAPSARELPAPSAGDSSAGFDAAVHETEEALRRLAEETGGLPASGRRPAVRASQFSARPRAGSIRGVLYDQLGGLLPGTSIALTHAASGAAYQVVTDPTGSFVLSDVPDGDYELTAVLPGFSSVKTAVTLRGGAAIQRNLTMPLGSLEETVTVVGDRGGAVAEKRPGRAAVRTARTIPDPGRVTFSGGVGGQIQVPHMTAHVPPVYPAELQAAGVTGVVTLTGRIGIDGYMADVRPVSDRHAIAIERDQLVVGPDVHPGLIAAAAYAVERWEYEPTRLNGVPVDVNITVTVRFDLR